MKLSLFCLFALVALASCSKDFNNPIVGRQVAQTCSFVTPDSAVHLQEAGLVSIVAHLNSNPQVCDSVYTVEFTTYQKWVSGSKWSLFVGIAIFVIGFGAFGIITSRGNTAKWTLGLAFGTLILGGAFIGGFYYFSTDREIRKADYVNYMAKDGSLENFWSTPAQTY